jgi:hypothetical protein
VIVLFDVWQQFVSLVVIIVTSGFLPEQQTSVAAKQVQTGTFSCCFSVLNGC